MPKKQRGAVSTLKLPYLKAVEAMAFSGLTFSKVVKTLKLIGLVVPDAKDTRLKNFYNKYRKEAHALDKEYIHNPILIQNRELGPLYYWAQVDGDPRISPEAEYVDRILEESRDLTLRRLVDLLLYLKKDPEDIAELIRKSSRSPVLRWDKNDVAFFKHFFWDPLSMKAQDWREYAAITPEDHMLPYIAKIPSMSHDDILFEAGIPLTMTVDAMADVMMRECYVNFEKRARKNQAEDGLAFLRAFRSLYGAKMTRDKVDGSMSDGQLLQRVEIFLHGEKAAPEPDVKENIPGEISDNSILDEHPSVREAILDEKDKKAKLPKESE